MHDPFATILDLHQNKNARIHAAFALENIADERAIQILAQALFTDPSPIVRHECAFALGETAAPKLAGPPLMKAVENDKHVFVRHEALLALGTLGDASFIPFVRKYLDDSDPVIAESAEIALERLST